MNSVGRTGHWENNTNFEEKRGWEEGLVGSTGGTRNVKTNVTFLEDKWGFGAGTKTIKRKTGFWRGLRIWAQRAGLGRGRTMLN